MDQKEMMSHIDDTLLKPFADWESIRKLCEEAVRCHTASVCVPPCYVRRIREAYGAALNICTVIGFPLGYQTTQVKLFEARQALTDGAGEIDMVINLTDVKNGSLDLVEEEIAALKEVCGTHILKVIVETCYLTEEEKELLCGIVTKAGADYIKTSTGFGTGGASLEDVGLFREHIGPEVKIKAAGGIRTREAMEAFLEAGCDRIGTSSMTELLG